MSPRTDGDAGPGPHGAVLSGERPVPADLPLSLPIASARVRPGAADCFGGRLPARLAPWAEDIETNWTHLEVAGPGWALRALCAWRVVDGAGRMVTSGFECRSDEDLAPWWGGARCGRWSAPSGRWPTSTCASTTAAASSSSRPGPRRPGGWRRRDGD